MPTLTTIAAALREHSPGVLPENFHVDHLGRLCFIEVASVVEDPAFCSHWYTPLPEYAVEAVLRDAMQSDALGHIHREVFGTPAYEASVIGSPEIEPRFFHDSDHGGSLGACYQAWRWSKGLTR